MEGSHRQQHFRQRNRNRTPRSSHRSSRLSLRLESSRLNPFVLKRRSKRAMTPNPKRIRRSHFRSNKDWCILCSRNTWEKARLLDAFRSLEKGISPSRTYNLSPPICCTGKECGKCQKMVCDDCIVFFRRYFESNQIEAPEFFSLEPSKDALGPCCWLTKKEWKDSQTSPTLPLVRPHDDFFQGCIFLAEYDLAIGSTPEGNMDVFSYGSSAACPYPVLHAVVDDPSFIGLVPKDILNETGTTYQLDLSKDIPLEIRNVLPAPLGFDVISVRVVIIDSKSPRIRPRKGSKVTTRMALDCTFVHPTKQDYPDVDAFILLGRIKGCPDLQLLLCRFFSEQTIVGSTFNDYKDLLETSTVWEAWRSGGSNGSTEKTNSLWKFISRLQRHRVTGTGL